MGPYKKRPRIHPGSSLFVNKRKRKLLYTKKSCKLKFTWHLGVYYDLKIYLRIKFT